MVADQLLGLASEHTRELQAEADRRRLASRTPRRPGLRTRVGRRFVDLGVRISGQCLDSLVQHPSLIRKEV